MTGDRWTPENIQKWKRHIRDFLAYTLAAFLVIYGTLNATELGLPILGAMFSLAGLMLGLPHMWQLGRERDDEA